jgi:hypothetical protein
VPEQEGAQDQVAEAGFVGHDGTEPRDGDRQDPTSRGGYRGQVGTLPGEHADLAQELRPAVPGDARGTGSAVPLDDFGGAVQHRDQVIGLVPVGEQHLASSHVALGAVPAQHLKLVSVQSRGPPRRRNQGITTAVTGTATSSHAAPGAGSLCSLTHCTLTHPGRLLSAHQRTGDLDPL